MLIAEIKAGPDISALSNVQRLVHLAVRHDSVQQDAIRAELTKARARAYNDELAIQARRAGCNRSGEMETGPTLTELNEISKADAESFSKSYNDDLTKAIIQIREDVPRANRNTYVSRLTTWEGERAQSKSGPLAAWTEASARSLAFEQWHKNNKVEGTATLEPEEAVCPVCLGWINRGEVSLKIASGNPPPYHPNCEHSWLAEPEKIDPTDCAEIWMG